MKLAALAAIHGNLPALEAVLEDIQRHAVDGILVAGCPERSCHHLHGNFVADKRVELGRSLLAELGINKARLRFEYIGAPMQERLREVLSAMDGSLRQLRPNPVAIASA